MDCNKEVRHVVICKRMRGKQIECIRVGSRAIEKNAYLQKTSMEAGCIYPTEEWRAKTGRKEGTQQEDPELS